MTSESAAASDDSRRQPNAWSHFVPHLLHYKWHYAGGLAALIAASFLIMLPPLVMRFAIDDIEAGTTTQRLAGFGGLILLLAVIESLARYYSRQLVSGTSRKVEYAVRNDVAMHLMRLDQHYYLGARTGDLMARCTNDLQWVRDLLGPTLMDMARSAIMLTVGVGFLLTINVKLALISIAYLPFVAVVVIYLETTMEDKFRAVQDQFGELTNRVQENISGIRAIKAYAQEESEIASFRADNRSLMQKTMNYAYYASAFFPAMIMATGIGTALVLWFGGRDVVAGRITIGQFVQFNAYLALLAAQLTSLGWIVTAWQQGNASMSRIAEVLRTEPGIADAPQPQRLDTVRGDIEFDDVSFAYNGKAVLEHVSVRIPAGSTVALVGGTGSGKTTLVNLLVRLHDPQQGRVTIDGVDVRDLPLEQLRASVGFVPQESFLFSDSLRDNIAFGRLDASDEELEQVLVTSQLTNDFDQLTDGLQTVIGERGTTLSGGQKQRAALARALLKDPPILVLDDALSHVDTHTEEEILRRLREFMAQRTTIMIAHRTSTLAGADRILVLDGATIAEQGTHEELVALGGVYARFYRRQILEEQVEGQDEGQDEDRTEEHGGSGGDGEDGAASP